VKEGEGFAKKKGLRERGAPWEKRFKESWGDGRGIEEEKPDEEKGSTEKGVEIGAR